MRVPGLDFLQRLAGRRMWNITVSADEDQSPAKPLVDSLKLTANYADMLWQGVLIGYGNRPGEVLEDEDSMRRARTYFEGAA